jgi:transposase
LDKEKIIFELLQKVEQLTREVQYLRERLSKYETPKNSNNSSIPPSKDENRPKRNQSLRENTGRKPGGQKGRKGNTLRMVDNPNITKMHLPEYCSYCGEDIRNTSYEFVGKRQVIDIPEIKFETTEHRIHKRVCGCGHTTKSSYPSQANAPVSYGNNIESLIGYFHTRQYVPFKRMQEIFHDIFRVPISEGGIHYLLNKLVKKSRPAYEMIKEKLQTNTVYAIGADETGMKINGGKNWAWVWQNDEATFITISDNRGGKTIEGAFKEGFTNSVLVHDCWKSHFNTPALSHQICTAHLLRELNYFSERYKQKWSSVFKLLLISGLDLKNKLGEVGYYCPVPQREAIQNRLSKLLSCPINGKYKELCTFQKRMRKYKNYIFTFLYHPKVPPDNNASERAIRNIKVKQKISGQFKSPTGGYNFAVLRSVTDTVIKNNQNILNSLKIIANLQHTD